MTARLTWHQSYPGGRIVAELGEVEIGAVFPGGKDVRWRCWLTSNPTFGEARDIAAAQARIEAEATLWLVKAGLQQVQHA